MIYNRIFLICISFFFSSVFAFEVEAPFAILMNADNGKILFEKNANVPHYPASLAKVIVALYVLETYPHLLDRTFQVSEEAVRTIRAEEKESSLYCIPSYLLEEDAKTIYLKEKENYTLYTLLRGYLIASACDAGNVIAEGISGDIGEFVEGLNTFVRGLGCEKTHLENPHGLHHPHQVSTAYELAYLSSLAIKNPVFKKIVASSYFIRPRSKGRNEQEFHQTNRLVREGEYFYPLAIGIKTGYTKFAGYNLIAAAKREDRTLIAVLLGGENLQRFTDAKNLFEAAFAERKESIKIIDRERIFKGKIEGGDSALSAQLSSDLFYEYFPSEKSNVKIQIYWDDLTLPIKKGQEVGHIQLIDEKERILISAPVFAQNSVRKTFFSMVQEGLKRVFRRAA